MRCNNGDKAANCRHNDAGKMDERTKAKTGDEYLAKSGVGSACGKCNTISVGIECGKCATSGMNILENMNIGEKCLTVSSAGSAYGKYETTSAGSAYGKYEKTSAGSYSKYETTSAGSAYGNCATLTQ